MRKKPIRILLVEDDVDHAHLISIILNGENGEVEIEILPSGEAALERLSRKKKDDDINDFVIPDLILLDINLPGMSGIEVLRAIKRDPVLKKIPTVMLTSSTMKEDIEESYSNYANSYVIKSFGLEDFKNSLSRLRQYWTKVNYPPNPDY